MDRRDLKSTFRHAGRYLRDLFTNSYFLVGLAALLGVLFLFYILFNNLLMPSITRHDVSVTVPRVISMPYEEASAMLSDRGLEVERMEQRFNPNQPRDAVIDQTPPPDALVKPGRHVYLTVNSGTVPMVKIPPLDGLSLREAINRLRALGLRVQETRPDSLPSPYPNTVTRQEPAAGDSLAEGSSIRLWYSTGLGNQYMTVPDVTGLSLSEARQTLQEHRLHAIVIGSEEAGENATVTRQSREPGTRVREGFEVRIFVGDAGQAPPPPPASDGQRP